MKKLFIVLLCTGVLATVSCRSKRDEERRRLEIERIRQEQEDAKLADEQKLLELQMRAKRDVGLHKAPIASHGDMSKGYYVVIGSFEVSSNARNFVSDQRSTFGDVALVKAGRWNYVTVGGRFGSHAAAVRKLHSISGLLDAGGLDEGEDDEDYEDEENEGDEGGGDDEGGGGDEENYDEEGGGDDEEEEEDEEEYGADLEKRDNTYSSGGVAWVLRL
jgi:hypothetical protein